MRRLTVLLLTLAMFVLLVPTASAAIHPLIGGDHCGPGSAQPNSARNNDICDPPGITPDGFFGPIPFPHEDPLGAADGNDQAQFRPLFATVCANSNAADHSWKADQADIDSFRALLCT